MSHAQYTWSSFHRIYLYVSVQIAVWAVLNFLELVLAHLRIELKIVATDQSNPDSISTQFQFQFQLTLTSPFAMLVSLLRGKWHLNRVINFVFDLPIFERLYQL